MIIQFFNQEASMSLSIPVYAEKSDKKHYSSIRQFADNYFYFGSYRARIVQVIDKNNYKVEVEKRKSPHWVRTSLRIGSFFTGVLPVVILFIRLDSKYRKSFQITNTSIQKKITDVDPIKITNKYNTIFRKAGINPTQATSLQKHVVFFADEDTGLLTPKSIQKGFNSLKIPNFFSSVGAKVVFHSLRRKVEKKDRKDFLTMQDIAKIGKHTNDTGIYDENGNFNVSQFEALKKFASNGDYLTRRDLTRFMHSQKKQPSTIEGKGASFGEFKLAFSLFSDYTAVDQKGHTEQAISLDRLKLMYETGPYLIFEQIALQKSNKHSI